MIQIDDFDQLPMGLIVRHLPAQVQALPQEDEAGKHWRWEFRTAVSAMAESTIVGFAAFRWDGERWLPRRADNAFFTAGDFAEWYEAPEGRVPAGQECGDATNFCVSAELVAERVKWVYVAQTSSGRRVKGEAVVELLAEVEEHSGEPQTPQEQLSANAALFRKSMLQHTGRALEYDEGSVLWLDNYVIRNRAMLKSNTGAFNTAGSWFGECLRRVYGGQWVANVDGEQWALRIDDKRVAFPFSRLYKHVIDEAGGGNSLVALFKSLAPATAPIATKAPPAKVATAPAPAPRQPAAAAEPPPAPPAPTAPPKPGWKFWKK